MYDFAAKQLLENINVFLQKKIEHSPFFIQEHMVALLDTAGTTGTELLSPTLKKTLIQKVYTTIHVLLQQKTIQPASALPLVNKSLRIAETLKFGIEQRDLKALRDECSKQLSAPVVSAVSPEGALLSPRGESQTIPKETIRTYHQRIDFFSGYLFQQMEKPKPWSMASNAEKILQRALDTINPYIKPGKVMPNFSQEFERIINLTEKHKLPELQQRCRQHIEACLEILEPTPVMATPQAEQDALQESMSLNTMMAKFDALSQPLTPLAMAPADKIHFDLLLQMLEQKIPNPEWLNVLFESFFDFYQLCKQVGDIGLAYKILDDNIILADRYNLSLIKHKFVLAQNELILAATGQKDATDILPKLPPFKTVEQILRGYFDTMADTAGAGQQQQYQAIAQKITALESRFIYQTIRSLLTNHILTKLGEGLDSFEKLMKILKPLGDRLIANGHYDFAWLFFADIKRILTHQAEEWHGKLTKTLHRISQALIASERPLHNIKGDWEHYREVLTKHREAFYPHIHQPAFPAQQQRYSKNMMELVAGWLEEAETYFGKPQVNYCLMGLGSMSRRTMVPGSDLECALLVADESVSWFREHVEEEIQNARAALNALYAFLEFRAASMGEIRGFRLDKEGHPRIEMRLIGTPISLIEKNSPKRKELRIDDEMTYSLLNACYIYGDKNLFSQYQQNLTDALNQPIKAEDPTTWRELIAKSFVPLHIKHLNDYNVMQLPDKVNQEGFNIKKYYIGPLMYVANDLALYHNIPYTDTQSALKLLHAQHKIDEQWATAYSQATTITDSIRLRLHQHHKEQFDTIFPMQAKTAAQQKGMLALTPDETAKLHLINWAILKPVKEALIALEKTDDARYLYHPGKIIVEEAIVRSYGVIEDGQTVFDAMNCIVATLLLMEADLDAYRLACLKFPPVYRNCYLKALSTFQTYFQPDVWHYLLDDLKYCPSPNGARQSTLEREQNFEHLLVRMTTTTAKSTHKKTKSAQLTWINTAGKQFSAALHPNIVNYLRDRKFLDNKGYLKMSQNLASETSGRHLVLHIDTQIDGQPVNVHLKVFPEMPDMEKAIGLIAERLVGWGTPNVQKARLQIGTQSYPVLISQTVMGTLLHSLIQGREAATLNDCLDERSYSQRFMLSLLLNQEDAKPSNFIAASHPLYKERYQLVCVDNDRSFFPALTEEEGTVVPIVKDITYCFEKMHQPLHKTVREEWLYLDGYHLLKEWLVDVDNLSQINQKLFSAEEIAKYFPRQTLQQNFVKSLKNQFGGAQAVKESILGITLAKQVISHVYVKFTRAQVYLRENPNATHYQLMLHIEPYLAKYYHNLLSDFSSIDTRFHNGFSLLYGEKREKSGAHQTKKTAFASLNTMHGKPMTVTDFLEEQAQSIPEAIKELQATHAAQVQWKGILASIQKEEKDGLTQLAWLYDMSLREKIVNELDFSNMSPAFQKDLFDLLVQIKTPFNVLRLERCIITDDQCIQILQASKQLRVLVITQCSNITDAIIKTITKSCPILEKLTLTQLPQLRQIDSRQSLLPQLFTPIGAKSAAVFGELYYLNVSDNPKLTEIHLQAKQLKTLRTSRCNRLKRGAFQSKRLQALNVEGCTELTTTRLTEFIKDATKLQTIELANCPKIFCTGFYMQFPYLLPIDVSVFTVQRLKEITQHLQSIAPRRPTEQQRSNLLEAMKVYKSASDQYKTQLLKAFESESVDVKQAAVLSMAELQRTDPEIMQAIAQLQKTHYKWLLTVPDILKVQLSDLPDAATLAAVEGMLSMPKLDPSIILTALKALIRKESTDIGQLTAYCIQAAKHKAADMRRIGIEGLIQLKNYPNNLCREIETIFTEVILGDDPEIRCMAIYGLAKIHTSAKELLNILKQLIPELEQRTLIPVIRYAKSYDASVYTLLCNINATLPYTTTKGLPPANIEQAMTAQNWKARKNAILSLKDYKTDSALTQKIIQALNFQHREVRIAGISTLGAKKLTAEIISALDALYQRDNDKDIRIDITNTLTYAPDQYYLQASKTLIGGLRSGDYRVQSASAKALSNISIFNEDVLKALLEAVTNSYTMVSLAAMDAVAHLTRPIVFQEYLQQALGITQAQRSFRSARSSQPNPTIARKRARIGMYDGRRASSNTETSRPLPDRPQQSAPAASLVGRPRR